MTHSMKNLVLSLSAAALLAALPAGLLAAPKGKPVRATITTSMGVIEVELEQEKAPISVDNFVMHAKAGDFNGTIWHRVIPGFMIQGGGMDAAMKPRPEGAMIKNESLNGLRNLRGTLAMARTNNPDSAKQQFFINVVDNAYLDGAPGKPGYSVFGKVLTGMDVVDKIAAVQTSSNGGMRDVPVQPVTIEKVVIH